ncbi:hypothetical protein JCM8547_003736, partial [Rhodosporidiobolus lusitaniae]
SPLVSPNPPPSPSPVTPDVIEGVEDWAVEEILEEKRGPDGIWYFVKWAGFPEEESTWEPRVNLEENQALDRWRAKKKEKKTRKTV